ncbi:hypothetical protein IFM89_026237 [Coptis chinensis]|uniref:Uncharacterized protein n=1 Tax=Coptis chinensis TaxID=261450 RepID=A0A835I6E4_9MAGN|nr:hypothetical protein IFM89_026237 [Coptis chinensis]
MDFDPIQIVMGHIPTTGMNLATALAAEREFRAAQEWKAGSVGPTSASPKRVSLIRLLEETDGDDEEKEKGVGNESICCVCMGRKKGAAFYSMWAHVL